LLLLVSCFLVAPGSASATTFPFLLSDLGVQAEVRDQVSIPAASGPIPGASVFWGGADPFVIQGLTLMTPDLFSVDVLLTTYELDDTNAIFDNSIDRVRFSMATRDASVQMDVSITLRRNLLDPTRSSLTELITVRNDTDETLWFAQFLDVSFGGRPAPLEVVNANSLRAQNAGGVFEESFTAADSVIQLGEFLGSPAVVWQVGAGAELSISKIKTVDVPEPSGLALAAFALIGLAAARRRRAAALVAGASLVLAAGSAQAVSLSDGSTNVEIGLDQNGAAVAEWFVDDVLHVTQAFSLSLDGQSIFLPMADVQPVDDTTATLTFSDGPVGQFSWLMSITFELTETAAGADLAETVSLANLVPDATLIFQQVVFPNLGGDNQDDQIQIQDNVLHVNDGLANLLEEVVLPFPDTSSVVPQLSASFTWEVGTGESLLVIKDKALTVPEPQSLLLLGLAILALGRARRRA
jgi:hypothetical protein